MKYRSSVALFASLLGASANAAYAQDANTYHEPTRGFFLERGSVVGSKKFAMDLTTGGGAATLITGLSGEVDTNSLGGALRIGLPNSELIVGSGFGTSEAVIKFGLPQMAFGQGGVTDWAVYVGGGRTDGEIATALGDVDLEATSFVGGLAMTLEIDRFLLSLVPQLDYIDGNDDDTWVFNFGVGLYYNIAQTEYGKVQAGFEYNYQNADDDVALCADEDDIGLGIRWMYNERVNMDFVMYQDTCDASTVSVPGFVRVNVVF